MLDLMRRKKRLKVVLWLVIFALALGMLLLFVPGQNVGNGGFDSSAASVDGDDISMKELSDVYRRMVESYTDKGRNKLDAETLKAIGVSRQALDALITARVVRYSGRRLGLSISPLEVREVVESNPNFQDRGVFIGVERYRALLAANNITVTQFEEGMRDMLMERKLRSIISDSMQISERVVREEFTRTNQEAQVSFVTLKQDDFRKRVSPTEADLRAHFDADKDKYRIGEKRRVQYLLLSFSEIAASLPVTPKELEDEWAKRPKEEQIDASHILFAVKEQAQEAEIRAKAEAVLKRAKAGEDFAALAKQFSEDPGSKDQGGNLGTFQRGRMVKEFEDAAFALNPGQMSDLVRTQYGFHIIKVLQHEAPTLESSRKSLEGTIQMNKAHELLKQKSQEAQKLAETQKDLSAIAKALKIPAEVKELGFLDKDSDPLAQGISQGLLDEIFRLKEINAIGKIADHPMGNALPKLLEVQLPKPPDFAEARPRLEKDYVDEKAAQLLQAEAKALSEEAARTGDLVGAAKKLGLTVKTTQSFKRDASPDADIGTAPQFNTAAFETAVGATSSPISLEEGKRLAVLQVKSRTQFDEAAFNKQKDELREKLLAPMRDNYYQEYLRRVQDDLEKAGKIRINQKALDQVSQIRYY